jgi:hypothetical protein
MNDHRIKIHGVLLTFVTRTAEPFTSMSTVMRHAEAVLARKTRLGL